MGARDLRLLLPLALLAAGGAALAAGAAEGGEKRYVIEQLVVSVGAEPGGGERVGQLRSGDAVVLLERQGEAARVRLASGTEGWVKASYLSADLPLRERLAAREHELEQLKAKLAAAPATPAAAAPATTAAVSANATPTPAEAPAPAAAPAAAPTAPAEALAGWPALLAAGLAGLVLGFAAGWRTLDRRIRAKYGGLRIY